MQSQKAQIMLNFWKLKTHFGKCSKILICGFRNISYYYQCCNVAVSTKKSTYWKCKYFVTVAIFQCNVSLLNIIIVLLTFECFNEPLIVSGHTLFCDSFLALSGNELALNGNKAVRLQSKSSKMEVIPKRKGQPIRKLTDSHRYALQSCRFSSLHVLQTHWLCCITQKSECWMVWVKPQGETGCTSALSKPLTSKIHSKHIKAFGLAPEMVMQRWNGHLQFSCPYWQFAG